MKNTRAGLLAIVCAGTFAFSSFQTGKIKGRIIPPNAATAVWLISSADTSKVLVNQGKFEIQNLKAGTYKLYIDAVEPYKDEVREGINITDNAVADLGDIELKR